MKIKAKVNVILSQAHQITSNRLSLFMTILTCAVVIREI
jgi:hypothetical protein